MSIQELGALGEFIGSIAVLVTLVYLAIQIRQNTRSIEESQRMARVEAMVTRNTNMENALIASALSEDMSDIEMRARTGGFRFTVRPRKIPPVAPRACTHCSGRGTVLSMGERLSR